MINWPSISNPAYPIEEKPENTVLSSNFDDGSVQRRRKYTRSRMTWVLQWSYMSNTDKNTLDEFYEETTAGGSLSFNWINPTTNKAYTVCFDGSTPYTKNLKTKDYWTVQVTIREE